MREMYLGLYTAIEACALAIASAMHSRDKLP